MPTDLAPLLHAVQDWRTYVILVLAFGFFPGFVLRLFLLLYPKDDDRRSELVAELYAVPRRNRWWFVAEQMETALFEGLSERRRRGPATSANETPEQPDISAPGADAGPEMGPITSRTFRPGTGIALQKTLEWVEKKIEMKIDHAAPQVQVPTPESPPSHTSQQPPGLSQLVRSKSRPANE